MNWLNEKWIKQSACGSNDERGDELTYIAIGLFQEVGTLNEIDVILVEYQWSSH